MTRLTTAILTYLAAINRPATMYELFKLGRVETVNKAVGRMLENGELETVEAESVVCVRVKRVETSTVTL